MFSIITLIAATAVVLKPLYCYCLQWMPLDEYVAQPYFQKSDLSKYMLDICLAKVDKKYSGCYPVPVTSNISDESGLLYVNNRYLRKTARPGLHVSV